MSRLERFIREEDKRNPLTDKELAVLLNFSRSRITQKRQALGIPDSRERLERLLREEIGELIMNAPHISERKAAKELNSRGFRISRSGISKIFHELRGAANAPGDESGGGPTRTSPVAPPAFAGQDAVRGEDDIFANLVGWDGSLSGKIEQAKAAVMYPPHGLHTLIVGATGVGKSEMAECMHKYALKNKRLTEAEFPFVVFNCADYAETPQLLLAQLFGYKKGAFTGAETDRDGLVARANGGILFLDEIHRLPPEGQEILYQIIDKSKYRKLGDFEFCYDINLMIICATSENIEDKLLNSFCRRLPMFIELPPLSLRPIGERADIIKTFFQKEAVRINKKILVKPTVMMALLVCMCVGNIGHLLSYIQVSAARAFLSHVMQNDGNDFITVAFSSLPIQVVNSLKNAQWEIAEIERYILDDHVFVPNYADEDVQEGFVFSSNFYRQLEDEYQQMVQKGLSCEIIDKMLNGKLEAKTNQIIRKIQEDTQQSHKQDLKTIVKPEILDLVQEMLRIGQIETSPHADTVFYCIAMHLNAFWERVQNGEPGITNKQLDRIKQDCPGEFGMAKEMAGAVNAHMGTELPEDEVGFIATYLRILLNQNGGVSFLSAERDRAPGVARASAGGEKTPAIICLCLTGAGRADSVGKIVAPEVETFDPAIEIVTLGLIAEEDVIDRINALGESKDILLIVGTIDPACPNIPFLSLTDILTRDKSEALRRILDAEYRKRRRAASFAGGADQTSVFRRDLVIVRDDAITKHDALRMMCQLLHRKGYVTKHYLQGVLEHEDIVVTAIERGVAIPHGRSDDIVTPVVCVMRLKTPVDWIDGMRVSLVLLLALNGDVKNGFPCIFRLLNNRIALQAIMRADDADTIMRILKNL
ncbi:MAG: sigma 54-interacting transcriptional regulator [Clostridiales Family XIII bacterium]|nr:sigma 54-interacting transcriptional regulator [Clostridiales Family XIII bacterium]